MKALKKKRFKLGKGFKPVPELMGGFHKDSPLITQAGIVNMRLSTKDNMVIVEFERPTMFFSLTKGGAENFISEYTENLKKLK